MSDELRALAEAATPGPWGDPSEVHYGDFGWGVYGCPAGETEDSEQGQADAAFIAAANPTAVLALLDERDALRAQVADLSAERDSYSDLAEMWEATADAERARIERVRALDSILSKVVEMYRHLVMDTAEDQALHARVIEQSDNALRLFRAALDQP